MWMWTYKETSCFHTGLCGEMRPKRPWWMLAADGGGADVFGGEEFVGLEDVRADLDGRGCSLLFFLLPGTIEFFEPIAPRAVRAVEEVVPERVTAVPLTSLESSGMGSLETNSFCSNCTTT